MVVDFFMFMWGCVDDNLEWDVIIKVRREDSCLGG